MIWSDAADGPQSQFNSTNRGYLHANSYPAFEKRVDQLVISITSDLIARARPLPEEINSYAGMLFANVLNAAPSFIS